MAGAPAAGVAAVPGAPAAPAAPTDPSHGSGLFEAIARPEPAKTAAAGDAGGGGSGLFAALDPKAQPPAQVAAQPAPAPGAAPAADVAAGAVDVSAVSDAYPGDDASKEQLAAWMGKLAEKRGLPPQLPVMASLVESGLKNLNFGDADSVGFFQMRLSYWNQGDYAGYPDDPKKQVDWFLDQAEQIKAQRESRGQSVTDPKQFGEWIADVERPAEQYRGRYQLQLDQANSLLKAAPPPAAPEAAAAAPAPAAQAVAEAAAPPAMAQGPGAKAEAALTEAKKFLGTPYKWGGSTPQTGFDCSGLVQWAYAQQGIQIPRVTDQQILATNGTAVKRSELLAGDLVFFRDSTGYVHHVGMSLGGDKFIHAPHTGDVVKISSLDEPYYKEQFTGGRRFDKAASAAPAAPAAPVAPVQPAAPAVDPVAVAQAQAAVARDAAEAGRQGSGLFKAISVQEARNHEEARALASDGSAPRRSDSALFLQAITPERAAEAKAAAQAAPVPPPAPEAAAPAPGAAAPAAPEVAAAAPAGSGPDLADVPAGYPGDDAGQRGAREVARQAGREGGAPAGAAGDGVARRVRRPQPRLRRRGQRRVLPDAHEHLGPGRVRRLREEPRAAGEVVHRPRARGQEAGDRARRRRLRQGPERLGRVDRGRRAARGAVPRPLPAAPRRGAPAAALSGAQRARRPRLSPRRRRCGSRGRRRHSPPPPVVGGVVVPVEGVVVVPVEGVVVVPVEGVVVVPVSGTVVVGAVVVVDVELSSGFFFGTLSAGSAAAARTFAETVASPTSISSAGAGASALGAAAGASSPPPAEAMPNAAPKATTAMPATMRSCRGCMVRTFLRARRPCQPADG